MKGSDVKLSSDRLDSDPVDAALRRIGSPTVKEEAARDIISVGQMPQATQAAIRAKGCNLICAPSLRSGRNLVCEFCHRARDTKNKEVLPLIVLWLEAGSTDLAQALNEVMGPFDELLAPDPRCVLVGAAKVADLYLAGDMFRV